MTQPVAKLKAENMFSFASHAQVQLEVSHNSWEQNLRLGSGYASHTAVRQWEQDVACHSSNKLLAQRQRLACILTRLMLSLQLPSKQADIIMEADDKPNIACIYKYHSIK